MIFLMSLFLVGCSQQKTTTIEKPLENIFVVDNAKMISDLDKQKMLEIGKDLNNKYKAQLLVVTIDSLNGENIANYSNTLFRDWGIGDKEKNNGVLLLISKNDKKMRIEVGYGLEGKLNDGYIGRELDILKAKFKENKFSEGILSTYSNLSVKIYEEYGEIKDIPTTTDQNKTVEKNKSHPPKISLLETFFIFFFSLSIFQQIGISIFASFVVLVMIKLGLINILLNLLFALTGKQNDNDSFGGGSSGGGGSDRDW